MDDNIARVADYAAKTIKRGRTDPDDLLMLPKSLSEVKQTAPAMTPEQKAIRIWFLRTMSAKSRPGRCMKLGIDLLRDLEK